jgi:hypothetical protein
MLLDFFYYWTEPNKSQTKMKFEMQKTWDTARRLRTWERNNINWNRNGNSTNRGNNGQPKPGTSTARVDALKDWGVKQTANGGTKPADM